MESDILFRKNRASIFFFEFLFYIFTMESMGNSDSKENINMERTQSSINLEKTYENELDEPSARTSREGEETSEDQVMNAMAQDPALAAFIAKSLSAGKKRKSMLASKMEPLEATMPRRSARVKSRTMQNMDKQAAPSRGASPNQKRKRTTSKKRTSAKASSKGTRKRASAKSQMQKKPRNRSRTKTATKKRTTTRSISRRRPKSN